MKSDFDFSSPLFKPDNKLFKLFIPVLFSTVKVLISPNGKPIKVIFYDDEGIERGSDSGHKLLELITLLRHTGETIGKDFFKN